MEFEDVVHRRRMVRAFDAERPVPAEVRDRLLDNALHAPSAGFSQGWGFLALEDPADRARFWAVAAPEEGPSRYSSVQAAPLIVVPMSNKDAYLDRYAEPDKGWTDRDESRWPVPYWHIDTGMAALLILLTAVDASLAACFIGIPPDRLDPFRAAFGVPGTYTPIGAILVGYGAPDTPSPSLARGRRSRAEVVHVGRW